MTLGTAALRLAVGTLTALPTGAVPRVTAGTARGAMLLAPLAAVPLGATVAAVLWAGSLLSLPSMAVAFAALGALALGSRCLHLDGLADVADGLTASYDRERSLAVMKGGTVGPAGAVALVVVLGVQAGALTAYVGDWTEAALAGLLVCASRAALWIACAEPVPPARPDGLGVTFTRTVPTPVAVAGWLVLAALAAAAEPWRGPLTVLVAGMAVVLLVRRAVRRLGGVTGDVFGAAIEVALAVLLLGVHS